MGPRRAAHRLNPAHDHDVCLSQGDLPRTDDRRIQARTAQPVDGCRRHRRRQAREQAGHAGDVPVILASAVRVAEQHLVNSRRIEPRDPIHQGAHDMCREIVGTAAGQGTGVPPERGPHRVVDKHLGHYRPPRLPRSAAYPTLSQSSWIIASLYHGQRVRSVLARPHSETQLAADVRTREYLQSASGDCVGVLLRASRWHDAVVLARPEQERQRDPVKVRAAVELR